jgi:hypothetical protein
MIYELRIYEVAPGRLHELHQRFETVTLKMFEKYGVRQAGFWTAEVGTSNELFYMLAWEDLAEREQKWDALMAEWNETQAATEGDRPLVLRRRNSFLRPTPYSSVH